MNLVLSRKAPKSWSHGLVYWMLLIFSMAALPLGMVVATMGVWFALQASAMIYLPLGLSVSMVVALYIVQRRQPSIVSTVLVR